ncbi:MAG: mechanosensitive ion channel family protein [Firmicutes bacterium]|nr:mechanosensitive ion channel family protein [Bacillota bacterium]MCL2255558.1 mechanosensitive ion channel family protein [Bacillota bacterium]
MNKNRTPKEKKLKEEELIPEIIPEECPEEEKKRNGLKQAFSKVVPIFGNQQTNCPKNLAAYLEKKRKKRVRNMIIFLIFTAIVVSVMVMSFLVQPIFGVGHALTDFVNTYVFQHRFTMGYDQYGAPILNEYGEQIRIYYADSAHPTLRLVIRTVVVASLGYIVITLASVLIKLLAVGNATKRRKTVVSLASSAIKYVGYIIILVMLFNVWGINQAILAAIVGALGIAIGFGAQGLISDLLTGLFLIFENNLQVGDIVTVNGFRGEIEDIGIRTTRIRSIIGDVKVLNNSQLKMFINMTMHRSLAICDLTIEYGEDVKRVEEVITKHLEVVAEKYPVISEGPFYKGIALFNERGVVLRVVAKCEEVERLQLDRDLNREFKLLFDENNIKLAVPVLNVGGDGEGAKKLKKK